VTDGRIASYGLICWDSLFTVPQFDFYFKIAIPKANKERLITERDEWGRIIHSAVLTH
jgi:hypothetical protein